tara:strand:+ start:106 stop:756 length:651 start_codon:yes stop_codon:yes gene_type:complete
MKTYKQLVNNTLIRLREREVSSIDETSYSKLIGLFVHDAIESIESAWQWSNLRETLDVTTQATVSLYSLTGTQDKSTILDVINDTNNCYMIYKTSAWFDNTYYNSTPASGTPKYYTFEGLDNVGDTRIKVYPIPDGVYNLKAKVVKRSPDILADDDTVKVPFLPVQALAYAMALEERGEDGGTSSISAKTLADGYLSDAISIDADKHPEDLIWEAT